MSPGSKGLFDDIKAYTIAHHMSCARHHDSLLVHYASHELSSINLRLQSQYAR